MWVFRKNKMDNNFNNNQKSDMNNASNDYQNNYNNPYNVPYNNEFQQGYGQQPYNMQQGYGQQLPKKPRKPIKAKWIVIPVLVILAIICVVLFIKTRKVKVKLDKYITIEYAGYDSKGQAYATFDVAKFYRDYGDKIERTNAKKKALKSEWGGLYSEVLKESKPVEDLYEDCIRGSLNISNNLSNGDTITYEWDINTKKALEYYNCEMEFSNINFIVSGLEEVKDFNPFDYIEITYSGTAPNGTASIAKDTSVSEMNDVYFTIDKDSGLSVGDTITVTASAYNSDDYFMEHYGEKIAKTEESYTVDGIPHYVADVNEIPSDIMDKMSSQGEDAIRAYVANDWEKPENLTGLTLVGNYFLTPKSGMDVRTNNYLYLIYKISAINPDPEENIDFYYYVCFTDIIMLADGTCSVDLSSYSVPAYGWFDSEGFKVGNYTYVGYENLDSLFNNMIVTKIENYEYTSTVQE
ncbi:MAG: hypothetical protein IJ141_01550 [Lachnospiraceae bacterium]|nr:hypothetical protein [Lachnospiraceae bacterium]